MGTNIGSATFYGTDAGNSIQLTLNCNPTAGLGANQYVNSKCFSLPAFGAHGLRNLSYTSGRGYFDSDIALAKTFHIAESHTVSFRAPAFSWLNYP